MESEPEYYIHLKQWQYNQAPSRQRFSDSQRIPGSRIRFKRGRWRDLD